jgi:hypothetical protein
MVNYSINISNTTSHFESLNIKKHDKWCCRSMFWHGTCTNMWVGRVLYFFYLWFQVTVLISSNISMIFSFCEHTSSIMYWRHDKGSLSMDTRRERKKRKAKNNMEVHHWKWNKGKRIHLGHNRKKSQQQRRVEETCPCPMCHEA